MRCASYTRATSSDPFAEEPKNTITLQNEHIAKFMKDHGWALKAKYSDRKHDPKCDTSFQELKEALLRREYDCIVVDSFYHFGKDMEQALEFTKKTLIPAGISFAVAEDDFCSEGLCEKDQVEYVRRKSGKFARERYKRNHASKEYCFRTFGFQFDESENRALIDEESMSIVREIFERMCQGELQSSIARDLTRRGIENPYDYCSRNTGYKRRCNTRGWTSKIVNSILDDVKYIGVYKGDFNPEEINIDFEPVIDMETFHKVKEMRWKHNTNKEGILPKTKGMCLFSRYMYDKESGTSLCYQNRGEEIIKYSYPKKGNFRYKKSKMLYQDFLRMAKEQLILEKQRCLQVIGKLDTEEWTDIKEKRKKVLKDRIGQLLEKTNQIEARKMARYRQLRSGEMTREEYEAEEKKYKGQMLPLDEKIREILNDLNQIDALFSDKNPWIRLFRDYEATEITAYDVRRYVKKMLVWRFEAVELVPKRVEFRDLFPPEWLEVRSDGKNQ